MARQAPAAAMPSAFTPSSRVHGPSTTRTLAMINAGSTPNKQQPSQQSPAHQFRRLGRVGLHDVGDHAVVQHDAVAGREVTHDRRDQQDGAEHCLGGAPPRQQAQQQIDPGQHDQAAGMSRKSTLSVRRPPVACQTARQNGKLPIATSHNEASSVSVGRLSAA